MYRAAALTVLYLLASPRGADSQEWREAADLGDYSKAAELLQSIVFDLPASDQFPDPTAAGHLATIYAHGLEVSRDPVLGCSISDRAVQSAMIQFRPRWLQRSSDSGETRTVRCTLPEELEEARDLIGC